MVVLRRVSTKIKTRFHAVFHGSFLDLGKSLCSRLVNNKLFHFSFNWTFWSSSFKNKLLLGVILIWTNSIYNQSDNGVCTVLTSEKWYKIPRIIIIKRITGWKIARSTRLTFVYWQSDKLSMNENMTTEKILLFHN